MRYDPDEKPGISNLIELMTVVTGESIQDVEARYDGSGYGQFKGDVADAIVELLDRRSRRATASCAATRPSCSGS